MLILNILPPEVKNEIKFKSIFKSIIFSLCLISFCIIAYSIVLYGCKFYLENYFLEISSKNVIATKNTDNYSKQVKDINKQISYIEGIEKNSVIWSNLIKFLFDNFPSDIKIKNININKSDNSMIISGIAGTRSSLILIRKYFEENNNFSLLSFPIQNLVEKQNINFEIKLLIKSYTLE